MPRIEGLIYSDNVPVGDWTFWHPGGHVRMRGTFAGGEIGVWSYFDSAGAALLEIDYGAESKYEYGQLGFDYGTMRDVVLEDPPTAEGPMSFAHLLVDWEQFVSDVRRSDPDADRRWVDELLTRDAVQLVLDRHPQARILVDPIDEAFKSITAEAPSLSVDRSAWWWRRAKPEPRASS